VAGHAGELVEVDRAAPVFVRSFEHAHVQFCPLLDSVNQVVNGPALVHTFADRGGHSFGDDAEELCPGLFNCKSTHGKARGRVTTSCGSLLRRFYSTSLLALACTMMHARAHSTRAYLPRSIHHPAVRRAPTAEGGPGTPHQARVSNKPWQQPTPTSPPARAASSTQSRCRKRSPGAPGAMRTDVHRRVARGVACMARRLVQRAKGQGRRES